MFFSPRLLHVFFTVFHCAPRCRCTRLSTPGGASIRWVRCCFLLVGGRSAVPAWGVVVPFVLCNLGKTGSARAGGKGRSHRVCAPVSVVVRGKGKPMADRHGRDESLLVRFAQQFGWRAYAIPVLIVLTLWVVVDIIASDPTEPTTTTSKSLSLIHI